MTEWGRFSLPDYQDPHRLVWSSYGPEGTGKTHFGLTAPAPIAVQLFDPKGVEGLLKQFKGKEIRPIEYRFCPSRYKDAKSKGDAARELWARFVEDYRLALTKARTVLWDKEDYVWETFRYAQFDDLTDRPANYYELYKEYRELVNEALDANVNLGLLQGVKEKWTLKKTTDRNGVVKETPTPSGIFERRGMREIPEIVQVNLEHWWDNGFQTRIHKCRQQATLRGVTLTNLDFATLAMLVFPESQASEWAS